MKHLLSLIISLLFLPGLAQEIEVISFTLDINDLTARRMPRTDNNGRLCAVLKIYAPDEITDIKGEKIGEIIENGLEKLIYVPHDTRRIDLLFKNHYPLKLIFDNFNVPSVTGGLTYEIKLKSDIANLPESPSMQNSSPISEEVTNNPDEEIILQMEEAYKNKDYLLVRELAMKIPESPRAQFLIGDSYCKVKYKDRNANEAMKWFLKAADNGNIEAMNGIGELYEGEIELPDKNVDYLEAVIWFRKAADLGNVDAMKNLGGLYWDGWGVNRDYIEAMIWFRKAADHGNSDAMLNIGCLYENGDGVNQDYNEAMKWFLKAAGNGSAHAMYRIGSLYQEGNGIEQNDDEALEWYKKAADMGDHNAILKLGRSYRDGDWIPQDYKEAIKWLKKGADIEDTWSIEELARMYRDGLGVKKDYNEAIKWYTLGVESGGTWMQEEIEKLKKLK